MEPQNHGGGRSLKEKTKIGECDFIETEEGWNIVHTEVNKTYQGKGIARKLVEAIIENANKNNQKVVAECSYAKRILEKKQK